MKTLSRLMAHIANGSLTKIRLTEVGKNNGGENTLISGGGRQCRRWSFVLRKSLPACVCVCMCLCLRMHVWPWVGGGFPSQKEKIPLPAFWSFSCTSTCQNKQLHMHTCAIVVHCTVYRVTQVTEGTLPLHQNVSRTLYKLNTSNSTWCKMEMEHIA